MVILCTTNLEILYDYLIYFDAFQFTDVIGYTLSFWVKFNEPIASREYVFISNGGQIDRSHGVAAIYNRGKLEFRFRKKSGQEWRAKSDDVLPGRWYHVVGTWGPHHGLTVYVNGVVVDSSAAPVTRSPLYSNTTEFNDFVIGKRNDNSHFGEEQRISLDEFNFWSEFKRPEEIRELGSLFIVSHDFCNSRQL